ncbi:DgyrCDS11978 [Dimorphilus gyrociliatus]|uniref:DgyrCDS11978 n=1 Tax=Dimorphilus gyrociliatus TaxID=2664684 RepID=A0A7I8W539_9ANNE|nr:DgyrCDS11978 [Dimorphilus gyrociliatus]
MISFHRLFFFFALLYPSFQDILDLDEEDTCYENNKPVFCLPKFENVVEGKKITASSTCGLKNKSRICLKKRNEYLKCDVCDSTDRTKQHPTDFLTDSDTPNKTCWISEALMTPPPHNVSIRIHFGKSFELTYISIVFCQDAPDSVALYKSMDYGQHWTPFQYYSSSCMDFYGVRPNQTITRDNEQEALCSPLKGGVSATYDTPTIAFSTLEHRPNSFNLDNSPVLQDWVTATDIKIIFDRLLQNNALASSYMTMHYAVSDLSIGGRCKCNGHADRCITDEFGRLKCVCKHNTEGRDCERCKPLYQDKPWARATKQNANECVRCNCNGHSNVCRFNKELYEWSGHTSGGICQDCKHNTAGRFCHYCKEKYYRDVTVKISHEQACKACDCHHYGSKGKVCNSANGQCPCKVGVIGRKCNLCATGYQQTRSKIVPCQRKISGRKSDRNRKHRRKKNCWKCLKRSKKANATKFCKRDYGKNCISQSFWPSYFVKDF